VHNLGAPNLKQNLNPGIRYRLGLSATPERQGDAEGTQAILDYFGDVVYEFPIKEAIDRNILCRYFYYPVLVRFTEKETEDYWNLTREIGRAMARENGDEMSARLKQLLLKRTRLIGSAAEKMPALKRTILELGYPLKKAIIYCGDGQTEGQDDDSIRQVVAACRLLGEECDARVRKFTCDESEEEREEILDGLRIGRLDGIVAIRCLDEGIDVPEARLGFLLASSNNPRQFVQRRGRLLRKAEGKDFAHIWDFIIDPPDFSGCDDDSAFNVERRLFQRELRRIVEFCRSAENGVAALNRLHDLRRRYNLLSAS
jgi:superfamily II DNA or RNA helicase